MVRITRRSLVQIQPPLLFLCRHERAAAYVDLGLVDLSPALEWLDPESVHHGQGAEADDCPVDGEALDLYDRLVARAEGQRRAWDDAGEGDRAGAASQR